MPGRSLVSRRRTRISANIAVNRELGRAWIDVQVVPNESIGDEPPDVEVTSKSVECLYYDSARKQVLYRSLLANEPVSPHRAARCSSSLQSGDRRCSPSFGWLR